MSLNMITFYGMVILLALCSSGAIQALASTTPPLAPQSGTTQNTAAKTTFPRMFSDILYDDDNGHARLWNPNSVANTFFINDTRVSGSSSTIILNIDQGAPPSLVICGTSGVTDGFFEISCTKPPREGAQLRYLVINAEPLPPPSPPSISKYFETRLGNMSKDIKLGPLPSIIQDQKTDIPILSQN